MRQGGCFCVFQVVIFGVAEEDRSTAICTFCDTDFVGTNGTLGGKYKSADLLAEQVDALWPKDAQN